ncbi:MAG TPA: hypothetical protein VFV23_14745 [Verrucomicrobiae bacterium]|nr:hypothetical protein [Verrucomicrobiae bacterium]
MKTNPVNDIGSSKNNNARIIAIGFLIALALCAAAAARGEATNSSVDPVGNYRLISVDGKTVPCTIDHEGTIMEVQSGTFAITNGHCTSVIFVSVGDRKNIRCETHAGYKLDGAELTMRWENAGETKGAVSGNTFTMTNEAMAYVYKK